MRVAILNPSFGNDFVRVARWAAKSRGRVQRHPEYLLTAAQVLIDAGHDVIFVEAAARNLPPEQSYDIVQNFRPDLLVIHATTPSIYNDIEQAKIIKARTKCKVAFVGQNVTAAPENGDKSPGLETPACPQKFFEGVRRVRVVDQRDEMPACVHAFHAARRGIRGGEKADDIFEIGRRCGCGDGRGRVGQIVVADQSHLERHIFSEYAQARAGPAKIAFGGENADGGSRA